jgi:hypothetical protein
MDVSQFGLFDVTGRAPSRTDPTPDPLPDLSAAYCGAPRVANDNHRGGARRMPRQRQSLLRFIPRVLREPGPA